MKIDEYIWVMCDAIREDGDVSLFFVLDEMINYLSGCKSKKKKDMLKCLQRCRVIMLFSTLNDASFFTLNGAISA